MKRVVVFSLIAILCAVAGTAQTTNKTSLVLPPPPPVGKGKALTLTLQIPPPKDGERIIGVTLIITTVKDIQDVQKEKDLVAPPPPIQFRKKEQGDKLTENSRWSFVSGTSDRWGLFKSHEPRPVLAIQREF